MLGTCADAQWAVMMSWGGAHTCCLLSLFAGAKQRKPRKKKDPNAPKKALSGFMFFSNTNRDRVKAANPGIPFGQVGMDMATPTNNVA